MAKRRVVITGVGVIAPNGIGKEAFWSALVQGKSGIKKITFFDTSKFPTQIAGEVQDFDPLKYMERKRANRMARFSQFTVACAKMAMENTGLKPEAINPENSAIIIGVSTTAMDIMCTIYQILLDKGVKNHSVMEVMRWEEKGECLWGWQY